MRTVNAAIGRVAESNGLNVPALRQRLEADGLSYNQFREDIRQDIILNRLREREVDNRIQISESELDNFIAEQAGVAADAQEVQPRADPAARSGERGLGAHRGDAQARRGPAGRS